MWIGRMPATPVLLILGTQALALYYLFVFPFGRCGAAQPSSPKWLRVLSRVLSGLVLALALHGLLLYALGWIERRDILENGCILLALLCIAQWSSYARTKSGFAFESGLRALVLLLAIAALSLSMPPFGAAAH